MHLQTLVTAFIFFSVGWFVRSEQTAKDSASNIAQSKHYSIDLPEDLQGSNLLPGTLIQLDSVCSESVIHTSFFKGSALYRDGAEIVHPIHKALSRHTIFDTEK